MSKDLGEEEGSVRRGGSQGLGRNTQAGAGLVALRDLAEAGREMLRPADTLQSQNHWTLSEC